MGNIEKNQAEPKKIAIYNGRFVPVELLWACDIHAVYLCRKSAPAAESMLEYALRFMNPLARSVGGIILSGDYGERPCCFLQLTDNHSVRMTEILRDQEVPVTAISVPPEDEKPEAVQYYIEEIHAVKAFLEEQYQKQIDPATLLEKVRLTNRIHGTLEKISVLRKEENPAFAFSEYVRLQYEMFRLEPEEAAGLAEAFLKEKEENKTESKKPIRLMLVGRAAAEDDEFLLDSVEQAGGAIVCECLDEGIWPWEIRFDLEDFSLENYARQRYLKGHRINYFHHSFHRRYAYIKRKCLEYRVEGVIWYQLSFDEIYDMEYECLAKWCDQDGISLLRVESSYEGAAEETAALAARVESFIQILKEKRNEQ